MIHTEKSMPSTPQMEVMCRLIFQNIVMIPVTITQHMAAIMNRMTRKAKMIFERERIHNP